MLSTGLPFVFTRGVVEENLTCQTSAASPNATDAAASLEYLKNLPSGQRCKQENMVGCHCTTMNRYGTASTVIKGQYTAYDDYACSDLIAPLEHLLGNCTSGGKVGGWVGIDHGLKMSVLIDHS